MKKMTKITNVNNELPQETFEALLLSFIHREEVAKGNLIGKHNIKILSVNSSVSGNDTIYEVEWEQQ